MESAGRRSLAAIGAAGESRHAGAEWAGIPGISRYFVGLRRLVASADAIDRSSGSDLDSTPYFERAPLAP